jgi:putative molybdopterin biosynthesis protein
MDARLDSPDEITTALRHLARQEQFLEVVDCAEATARFHRHLVLRPLASETLSLSRALGRVLATAAVAQVDVPGFDRASVDGFAGRAADTAAASERNPRTLTLNREILTPRVEPRIAITPGTATLIATGGMVPRGADAVVMIEHTEARDNAAGATVIDLHRPASPGQFVAFAGGDIARGETALCAGTVLTSREIGTLAAIGRATVEVFRRPRVAVISTGDEIVIPGAPLPAGGVYDSNGAILAAAVVEAGGEAVPLGIGADQDDTLARLVDEGLSCADLVLLSGGTSKGAGDVCYRVVARYTDPGIVVHGVALKPGKPVCLAVTRGKPLIVLPGFPTSAIFTFHEFVAPVIRALAGLPPDRPRPVERRDAAGVLGAAEITQRRSCRRSAGPSRLGGCDRERRKAIWARFSAASGGALRFRCAPGAARAPRRPSFHRIARGDRRLPRSIGGRVRPVRFPQTTNDRTLSPV